MVAFEEEEALQVEVVDLFTVGPVSFEAGVELFAVEPFDAGAVALEGVQDAALGADAFAEEIEEGLEDVLGELSPAVLDVSLVAVAACDAPAGRGVCCLALGDVLHESPDEGGASFFGLAAPDELQVAVHAGAEALVVEILFGLGGFFEEASQGWLALDPGDGEVDFVAGAGEGAVMSLRRRSRTETWRRCWYFTGRGLSELV
ncbi:hypothetical protein [Streptomyces sp. C8S0]|uniref:hypothetical protein n=1 Tax=Streptomyces sp. C8S0 TaxID=2585716 RepID=UPI001D04E03A|nr:hypothetical protein [Streptomyces sp. C8S0]